MNNLDTLIYHMDKLQYLVWSTPFIPSKLYHRSWGKVIATIYSVALKQYELSHEHQTSNV